MLEDNLLSWLPLFTYTFDVIHIPQPYKQILCVLFMYFPLQQLLKLEECVLRFR